MDQVPQKERWQEWLQRLRREHPILNEEDLRHEEGEEKQLLLRLQKKLGKTEREINEWLHLMG